jgi:hypothetical protein
MASKSSENHNYHPAPKRVGFNATTTIRKVPRLKYSEPLPLHSPNNQQNFNEGTNMFSMFGRQRGERRAPDMNGFNHPLNEGESTSYYNSQIFGILKNKSAKVKNESKSKSENENENENNQLLVSSYGNERNYRFYNHNGPPQEILNMSSTNSAINQKTFNKMNFKPMPIVSNKKSKKGKKNISSLLLRMFGKGKKSNGNEEDKEEEEEEENLFAYYNRITKNNPVKKSPFNQSYSLYLPQNFNQPISSHVPSYASSYAPLYIPSSYISPSYTPSYASPSYNNVNNLYGNGATTQPSQSILQQPILQQPILQKPLPSPIHPYNRRPHDLNQRAWFALEEKDKNSRKKSVSIASKSQKRYIPKYKSSRMYKERHNEATGHEVINYEFEKNISESGTVVNNEGNPINTSYHYNEEELNTKLGGKKSTKKSVKKNTKKSVKKNTKKSVKK